MHGHLSHDYPVDLPAAGIWEIYRGLEAGRLVNQLLKDKLGTVEVVQGDGGVGTILKVTFAPGALAVAGPTYMKEIFTKVDDETRTKETEVIEGGHKDLGFERLGFSLQIIEKDTASSIIRSSINYDIDDKLKDVAAHVTTKPLEIMAEAICNYLKEKRSS